jgi:8-oxo-dGTP diphosphatase
LAQSDYVPWAVTDVCPELPELRIVMPEDRDCKRRRGVVAVIRRGDRLLVIRRSQSVVAPGAYCFPGGAIEGDETEEQALVREIMEELGACVRPLRRIWSNTTPWNVELTWWQAEAEPDCQYRPNPAEVESIHWLTTAEMSELPELLASNRHFLSALTSGEIDFDC